MWGGLLWSRALLSISFILFVALSVVFEGKKSLQMIKESFWLQTMLALVLVYSISGFWSEDKAQWVKTVQVKLPLLFMPFTLGVLVNISRETYNKLLYVFVGLVVISTGWSYIFYFLTENIALTYLQAKVLPVPMYDDHVRFSWLVVVVFMLLIDRILKVTEKRERLILLSLLAYLVVYLHVLAAKTGVLGLYIVMAIFLWKWVSGKWRFWGLMILLFLPIVAWYLLPSFQSRLRFIIWDFQNYSRGNYTEGLSDAPRIESLKAGWDIVKSNFVTGVGSGDVLHQTNQWYRIHAPFLKPYEQLLPCNQLMMFVCSGGVLMGLIALVFFLSPLWIKVLKNNYLWVAFHAVALFGFMYEISLEVQNGVFVYIFFGIYIYANTLVNKVNHSIDFK
jgi:hypothetical protein